MDDTWRDWHYEPPKPGGSLLRSRSERDIEPFVEVMMVDNHSSPGLPKSQIPQFPMDFWLNSRYKLLHEEKNPFAAALSEALDSPPDLLVSQQPQSLEEERMVQQRETRTSGDDPLADHTIPNCKRRRTQNGTSTNMSQTEQSSSVMDSAAVVDYLQRILANQDVLESKIEKISNRLSFIEKVQKHSAIGGKTLTEAQYQQMRAEYNLTDGEDITSKFLQF